LNFSRNPKHAILRNWMALCLSGSALALAGCESQSASPFKLLGESNTGGDSAEAKPPHISNWFPTADPVRMAAAGTQIFFVSPDRADSLTYSYELDGASIAGSDPAVSLQSASLSAGAHSLKAIVSNSAGSDNHVFNIYRNTPPTLTGETPSSASVAVASNGTFTFQVSGSDPDSGDSVSYAWRLDGGASARLLPVSGAGISQAVFAADPSLVGTHVVSVVASDGLDTVVRSWNMTVVAPVTITAFTPTVDPVVLGASSSATFAVTPSSTTGVTYSYQLDGVDRPEVTASLLLTGSGLTPGMHSLIAKVSNAGSSDSHTFHIRRNSAPIITGFVPSTSTNTVSQGGSLSLSVTAVDPDTDTLSYTWKINGATATELAATGASATFTGAAAFLGSNSVTVDITDGYDTVTRAWTVLVVAPVAISSWSPTADPVVLSASTTVPFTIVASGGGSMTYDWKLDGVAQSSTAAVQNISGSALSNGAHTLVAKVTSGASSDTHTFNLRRNRAPVLVSASPAAAGNVVAYTSNLPLSTSASDADGDTLTYTWKLDGVANPAVFSGTGASVTFQPNASLVGNHLITAEITDGYDITIASWTAQVIAPISITAHTPTSNPVVFGTNSSYAFAVTPSASAGVTYSYKLDNVVQSSTQAFLQLTSADLTSGNHQLIATVTAGGTTDSWTYNLRKNSAPVIVLGSPATSGTVIPYTTTLPVSVNASDVDGDTLTYTWKLNGASNPSVLVGTGNSIVFTPTASQVGTNTITVNVTDGFDPISYTWTIEVVAPTVISTWSPTTNPVRMGASTTTAFSVTAGGTGVTYAWTLNGSATGGGTSFVNVNGSQITSGSNTLGVSVTSSSGSDSHSFNILKNNPPVVASSTPAAAGNLMSFSSTLAMSVTATDADADTLTYAWKLNGSANPSVFSGNGSSVSFQPGSAFQGYNNVSVDVNDGYDTTTYSWSVQVVAPITISSYSPTGTPIVFAGSSSKTFSVTPSVTSGVTYSYALDGTALPSTDAFLVVSGSSLTTGAHTLVATVAAGGSSASQTFNLRKNTAPTVIASSPSQTGISFPYTATQSFSATAVDPDGDSLIYTYKLNGSPNASVLVGQAGGSIVFQPTIANIGTNVVTVEVYDGYDTTAYSWTINVIAPVLIGSWSPTANPVRVQALGSTAYSINVSDSSGVTYAWKLNGSTLSQTQSFINLAGSSLTTGSNTVLATVTSGSGSDSHTFNVVKNKVPVIGATTPASAGNIVAYTSTLAFTASASDADTDGLTYSWKLNGSNNPSALSASNGNATLQPSVAYLGFNVVSVEVTDGFDTVTYSWSVQIVDPISITAFSPVANPIVFGAATSKTFSVSTNLTSGVSYLYKIDGVTQPGTGAFLVVDGSTLSTGNHTLTETVSAGGSNATQSFNLRKNAAPIVAASSPSSAGATIPYTSTLTMSVSAIDGDADTLTYSWKLDGAANAGYIAGSGASITFQPDVALVGNHTVTVAISDGFDITNFSWPITVTTPVLISSWTPSTSPVRIPVNGSTNLSVSSSGGGSPTYTWALNGATQGSTSSFISVAGSSLASGTSTLIATVTSGATNDSHTFTLQKNSLPTLGASSPAAAGTQLSYTSSQAFSIAATDADSDTLTYTWKVNGASNSALTATNGTASFQPSVGMVGSNVISVDISDSYDTVTYSWAIQVLAPVTITASTPAGLQVFGAATTKTFSVTPSYTNGVTYSYALNGTALPGSSTFITVVGSQLPSGNSTLTASVTSGGTTASQNFNLKKNTPPAITASSPAQTGFALAYTTTQAFSVTANDYDADTMTYAWKLNGATNGGVLVGTGAAITFTPGAGQVGVNTVTVDVSDGYDTTTYAWTITVLPPVTISSYIPSGSPVVFGAASSFTFSVNPNTTSGVTYTYKLDGVDRSETSSYIVLANSDLGAAGAHTLIAKVANNGSNDSHSFSLRKNSPPALGTSTPGASGNSVPLNSPISVSIPVTDADADSLTFTWKLNGGSLGTYVTTGSSLSSGTYTSNATFTPTSTGQVGANTLSVTVSDGYDTSTYSWSINVVNPVVVQINGSSPSGCPSTGVAVNLASTNTSQNFTISATGKDPVSYTWTLDGATVGTNSSLYTMDPSTLSINGTNFGAHNLVVTVADYNSSQSCTFNLKHNAKPTLSTAIPTTSPTQVYYKTAINSAQGLYLRVSGADTNSDTLSYVWTFDNNPSSTYLTPRPTGYEAYFNPNASTALLATNPHTITVKAYDGLEYSTIQSWTVNVTYLSDECNNLAPGNICTIGGDGNTGSGLTVTPGNQQNFKIQPIAILDDGSGNLFISDYLNMSVWYYRVGSAGTFFGKAFTSGQVQVIVGNGTAGNNLGSAAPGQAFKLNIPRQMAYDSVLGNLYIADSGNNRVVRMNITTGNIDTPLGTGVTNSVLPTYTSGASTQCTTPFGLAIKNTNPRLLYVTCSGQNLIKQMVIGPTNDTNYLSAATVVSTGASTTPQGMDIDSAGNPYWAEFGTCRLMAFNSQASGNLVVNGVSIAAGSTGILMNTAGTCPGASTAGTTLAASVVRQPSWVTLFSNNTARTTVDGFFLTASVGECRVMFANTSGSSLYFGGNASPITTGQTGWAFNTSGTCGYNGDNLSANAANFNINNNWGGITIDKLPGQAPTKLYMADINNFRVRAIDLSNSNSSSATGYVTATIGAGFNRAGLNADPAGAGDMYFNNPLYLAIDDLSSSLYISDTSNSRIRKINLINGQGSTVVSRGAGNGSTENIDPQLLFMRNPRGLALYQQNGINHLLYGDQTSSNCLVRAWNTSPTTDMTFFNISIIANTVASVAGNFSQGCSTFTGPQNTGATATHMNNVEGIATDGTNLYVADQAHCIMKVTPSGLISTHVGLCGTSGNVSGTTGSTNTTRLNNVQQIASDPAYASYGNLFIADYGNSVIKYVNMAPVSVFGIPAASGGIGNVGTILTGIGNSAGIAAFDTQVCYSSLTYHDVYCYPRSNLTGVPTLIVGSSQANLERAGSPFVREQEGIVASLARLNSPRSLAFDSAGNLYIADQTNHLIRKVAKWW
jgi:hypothetical protein